MNDKKVRVRFAPSPTGPLHIGGVRTALFNYLFAKKYNGYFILRIEDTDQTRYVKGAEEYIIESLEWCGIKFNEGVSVGGSHAPYRQSERKEIYKKFAEQLIKSNHAYYAFDTAEELDNKRKEYEKNKATFQYNSNTRLSMKNSLSMADEEVCNNINEEVPYVIRIKVPENENIEFNDIIRQKVIFNSSQVDDKVLYKSDGMPTYHLANVVDDYLMQISHVIRGEEWLSSTPIHVLLYRYLGIENNMPEFAHLPLLLKPDGKGKLSKRDGDKLGFPVFPLKWVDPNTNEISSGYRESGYFPESFINFLTFLGWNPGTTQELFTLDELVEAFSLEKVGKSGSKFDFEKAKWFNHQYLIMKTDEELCNLFMPILKEKNIDVCYDYVTKVCSILKERVNFVNEFWNQGYYFFIQPQEYDSKIIKDKWKENTPVILNEIIKLLISSEDFCSKPLEETVKNYLHSQNLNIGQIMSAIRISLVGTAIGPGVFEIAEIIGKNETIERLKKAIKEIKIS